MFCGHAARHKSKIDEGRRNDNIQEREETLTKTHLKSHIQLEMLREDGVVGAKMHLTLKLVQAQGIWIHKHVDVRIGGSQTRLLIHSHVAREISPFFHCTTHKQRVSMHVCPSHNHTSDEQHRVHGHVLEAEKQALLTRG